MDKDNRHYHFYSVKKQLATRQLINKCIKSKEYRITEEEFKNVEIVIPGRGTAMNTGYDKKNDKI